MSTAPVTATAITIIAMTVPIIIFLTLLLFSAICVLRFHEKFIYKILQDKFYVVNFYDIVFLVIFNSEINPAVNSAINSVINPAINSVIKSAISPIINTAINSVINKLKNSKIKRNGCG